MQGGVWLPPSLFLSSLSFCTFKQIHHVTCLCLELSEAVIFNSKFVAALGGRESHIRVHLGGQTIQQLSVVIMLFTYICQPSKHYVMVDTPSNAGEQISGNVLSHTCRRNKMKVADFLLRVQTRTHLTRTQSNTSSLSFMQLSSSFSPCSSSFHCSSPSHHSLTLRSSPPPIILRVSLKEHTG